jgi:Toprim domain
VLAALDAKGFVDDRARRPATKAERRAFIEASILEAQEKWEDIVPSWFSKEDKQRTLARSEESVAYGLRLRKITLPVPPVLRRWSINGHICAVQRLDGEITAVQTKDCYFPGSRKTTYGYLGDGAVRLTEPTGDELGLAEGVETALSATQMFSIPCWAVLGSKRLDAVRLPSGINRVHVFADNDEGGREGAQKAVARYCNREYRHVTVHWPDDEYNDWNDVLCKRVVINAKKS